MILESQGSDLLFVISVNFSFHVLSSVFQPVLTLHHCSLRLCQMVSDQFQHSVNLSLRKGKPKIAQDQG